MKTIKELQQERKPWVINPLKVDPVEPEKPTNRVEVRCVTPEEIIKQQEPKHAVTRKSGGLIEQLHDRVLINVSTRTLPNNSGIRRHWMLKTARAWHCGILGREITPGEIVECHDAADFNNLTCTMPDGPFCEIIEEVRQ